MITFMTGRRSVCVLLGLLIATSVSAQTLEEQYELFLQTLGQKCERLGFQRDVNDDLEPGQAGPNLFAFCTGIPAVGQGPGTTTPGVTGGGSGATAGRPGRSNDAAIRRRREAVKAEQSANTNTNRHARGGAASSDTSLLANNNVFMSFDYRDEEQDITRYEDGRNAHRFTLTAGADTRIGDTVFVGIALGVDELSGRFASGGDYDTRGYNMTLYASWLPVESWFIDVSAGYDAKDIETSRIVGRRIAFLPTGMTEPRISFSPPYAPVDGDTDSTVLTAELSTGYDLQFGSLTIGPRAGVTVVNTTVDGYVESGNSPMSLAFDQQKERSLQTAAGIQASSAFTWNSIVILPQLNADWINERRNDQRVINARFAEDLRPIPVKFGFLNQPPDRDVYNVRLSTVAIYQNGVSAFAAIEKLFAHNYRDQFGASIGVRWEL
jgi:uncharacterized protein YhjY with autotransporter beta-barrel domain